MSKIALITGATSGIGTAIAEIFADHQINLILCGRRAERLNDLEKRLSSKVRVHTLQFDVRDQQAVEQAISSIPNDFKEIDILVNNAGNAHGMGPIDEGDIADWDAMIDGNVKGLLYVSRAVMPGMVERKTGHIVNIGSTAGKITYEGGGVYCASKKAVEAISESMRLDLTKHGIKVTNIAPGLVETEFSMVRFKGDKERSEIVYQGYEALEAMDIADIVYYAIAAPDRVTIADVVVYPKAQASPTAVYKK